jgi:hypothetical protein
MLSLPMPFGAFQPSKPAPGGPVTVFPWGREQELLASCDVRQLHLHSRQSLRPTAASACSTLRVMKTFAKPSLGKNNSKAGTRKEARPHSHHQSRVQRPCTDLGTEDDFRAGKDVPVTMRWEPQQDPVRGLRWLKSSERHRQAEHPWGSLGYARDRLFDSAPSARCHAINL